ncbi:reverse transcriptase family protein [Maridesulfovibrio sp.]|uniref:reverse transcriptase family protein n=1 Tax=Maridesulfovibrio sp. TaxID=2795000 RepID=UPI002A18E040|nr:reverse transcriptase family protein [Maridesulfovibrio sp.]
MRRSQFQIYLWAVGVLQPVTPTAIRRFLEKAFPNASEGLRTKDVKEKLEEMFEVHLVVRALNDIDYLYSLTQLGSQVIPYKLRKHRDKARIFFLKDVAQAARKSCKLKEQGLELTGVSPVSESSSNIQHRRPIATLADTVDRIYWSPIFKQHNKFAGPNPCSDSLCFDLYSFSSTDELANACMVLELDRLNLDIGQLATAIGVSPNLLTSLGNKSESFYRRFEIGKRSGGRRVIHSPRVFLKTVQYWILDYILYSLPLNDSCHSFRRGHSILTNANNHVGSKFVANIDIVDYFGSISEGLIRRRLLSHFGSALSMWIAKLCTANDSLPQGAPTSPILSNFCLKNFDDRMNQFCDETSLQYSRYADDITISGDCIDSVRRSLDFATQELAIYRLKINQKKTRIASLSGQQNVTGVVVNQVAQPPRKLRKRIRAMFHQASLHPEKYYARVNELQGYISYIKGYPHLADKKCISDYEGILASLKSHIL